MTSSDSEPRRGIAPPRFRDESGDIASVVIAFAVTVLVFYTSVHIALLYHGKSVIAAAAQDALAAAQLEDGTVDDGRAAANRTLQLAPGIGSVTVNVVINSANTEVQVTVTGKVETVLVELENDISTTVVGPKERFYTETERP